MIRFRADGLIHQSYKAPLRSLLHYGKHGLKVDRVGPQDTKQILTAKKELARCPQTKFLTLLWSVAIGSSHNRSSWSKGLEDGCLSPSSITFRISCFLRLSVPDLR